MNSNAWYRKVCGCFQEHIYSKEDEVGAPSSELSDRLTCRNLLIIFPVNPDIIKQGRSLN